jgi:hypothetical protein
MLNPKMLETIHQANNPSWKTHYKSAMNPKTQQKWHNSAKAKVRYYSMTQLICITLYIGQFSKGTKSIWSNDYNTLSNTPTIRKCNRFGISLLGIVS